jgi:hypothetical protein
MGNRDLNDMMEFDHVIRVSPDGTVNANPSRDWPLTPHSPESVIETRYDGQIMKAHEDRWAESVRSQGWEPERGWSGQYDYSAFMHGSEYMGGSLEDHIRKTPGLWVVVVGICLRGGPDPDEIVTCVYCDAEIELQDTELWENLGAGEPGSDAARYCDEAADHLHAGEFDNEDEDEVAGWAVLHMDDSPDSESYVVTSAPDPLKRERIKALTHMTLEDAQAASRDIRPGRVVRVTDLAVMNEDGTAIPDPRDYVITLHPAPIADQAEHIATLPKLTYSGARTEVLNRWLASHASLGRVVRVSDMTEIRDEG